MDHHYTLFIDEAGDDKVERLKPGTPDGNSEWLCLGGYLVRATAESDLERRRDEILKAIGQKPGGVLHFRNLKPGSRALATKTLASKGSPARGFVVCSLKQTMLNHHNARAAAASVNPRDYLYNWVVRLLLERVTQATAPLLQMMHVRTTPSRNRVTAEPQRSPRPGSGYPQAPLLTEPYTLQ